MKIKNLLDDLSPMSFDDVLEYISKIVEKKGEKVFIVTPNTEIFMMQLTDKEYRDVVKRADLALPDSIGVVMAGKILGKPIGERIPGSVLVEKLAERLSKQPITVGFLGGKPGVALEASERLSLKYPGLKVAFAVPEWIDSGLKCDVLFVAFGSPKQEVWIDKNLEKIDVKVAIGVGGAFDYFAGEVRRAPGWVRNLGFEWLFRLIVQPWRVRRQLKLASFIFLLLREKLSEMV